MKKKSWLTLSLLMVLTACVPQRKYQDLENAYKELEQKKKACDDELSAMATQKEGVQKQNIDLKDHVSKLVADSIETHTLFESNKRLYGELRSSYEALLKNNQLEEEKMVTELKKLEAKLTAKELELAQKEANLNKNIKKNEEMRIELDSIHQDLMRQQARVVELQSILNAKDSAVKALNSKLTEALLGFKDKGLSVEIRNGKVYVSMDEKLLFASGSIVVDKKGQEALLELAKSIQDMNDIMIMVEGHTDDVPMHTAQIKDNWDLSVLRATSIVRILTKEGKVDPTRFIAAGRGEYMPVDPAKTPEARAKNRRTEIILSPKLDEIYKLLDQQ
ncbi:MAG: OmpA family protein [Bacteroidetes bacterium]|nr:OmpA family protein [Bacteroidota bacterium]